MPRSLSARLRSPAIARAFLWVFPLGALGVLGCAAEERRAETAIEYAENAKLEYEQGVRAVEAESWEVATEVLNEVKRKYSYSRYARLAELRLADADLAQDKYAEAVAGYKGFAHDYPNDPEVPYARFRIAKAEYESVSQSVLLPPLEERDLASVNDALATIRGYLEDFPTSPHTEDLRYMLEVVVGLLARHELYVARYYLREDRFDAAAARVLHGLESFDDDSGLEAEGLLLLAEIRLKQKNRAEARVVLERLLAQHPESPFSVPARRYLAALGENVRVRRQADNAGSPAANQSE